MSRILRWLANHFEPGNRVFVVPPPTTPRPAAPTPPPDRYRAERQQINDEFGALVSEWERLSGQQWPPETRR